MARIRLGVLAVLVLVSGALAAASVDDLVRQLRAEDAAVRRAAARALGEMEAKARDAIPELEDALKDEDPGVRRTAAWALERIRGEQKPADAKALAKEATLLVEGLEDLWKKYVLDYDNLTDDELRKLVDGYNKAVELFSQALEVEDNPAYNGRLLLLAKRLRKAIFAQTKRREQKKLEERRKNQPERPPSDRPKPKPEPESLPGPKTEPEVDPFDGLMKTLRESTGDERLRAAEELGKLGERAVQPLNELLDGEEKALHPAAALALYRTGKAEQVSLFALMGLLDEETPKPVRLDAVKTIGLIGPPAAAAAPGLMIALKDKDQDVRLAAVRSVGLIGPAAKKASRMLGDALRDSNAELRHRAAEALGNVGPAAANGVYGLVRAIGDDSDKELQRLAIEALGKIGPETALVMKALTEQLASFTYELREAAIVALGNIGPEAQRATPELLNLLVVEQRDELRKKAADTLVALGEPAVRPITKALKDKRTDLRWYACEILGRIGPDAKSAVGGLRGALGDDQEVVRIAAAGALGKLGDAAKPAVSALAKALGDSSWKVRKAAAEALGAIGPGAKSAARQLKKAAAEDEDSEVKKAAEAAIAAIG